MRILVPLVLLLVLLGALFVDSRRETRGAEPIAPTGATGWINTIESDNLKN